MDILSDDEIIEAIKGIKVDSSVLELKKTFAYNGFNPVTIYKEMIVNAENEEVFRKDLNILLVVAMTRGTNITSILNKSSAAAKEILVPIFKRYNIKKGMNKLQDDNNTTITLNRLMSSFPNVCYQLARLNVIRDPVGENSTLPVPLRFTSAPSIITREEVFEEWKDWAKKFDAIINPSPDPAKVESYGLIAYRNQSFKGSIQNI
jgi:hypothetical protein